MKRKWLMVPLVTGMLAVGLTGATALAHNDDGEDGTPKETVAGKVAEILGIDDEQTVKDALQQATREVQMDKLEHRLDHMVEAEALTQEQADEYLAWYESRPEGPNLHLNSHRQFGFDGNGEGEKGQPRQGFNRRGGEGQNFPGFGQRPDGGEGAEFRELPNGREFPGRGELRSRFSERFGGQEFPGRGGEVPSEDLNDVPEGSGTSF